MQCVILAAGRGTRMGELTEHVPKPMLTVGQKNLIEWKLDALPERVDEVVIVVGYLGSAIQKHFGGMCRGKRILYVEQGNPVGGTADALWQARSILNGRFLVLNGDDLYGRVDLATLASMERDWGVLVQQVEDGYVGGLVRTDAEGFVEEIIEGVRAAAGDLANTNTFVLDTRIFDFPMVPKAEGSGEYGLPQTVVAAARALSVPIRAVSATQWIPITTPEDLARATALVRDVV